MWRQFQTLRFKLAALNLVLFGVILATVCIVILTLRVRSRRADFDAWIKSVATDMMAELREPDSIASRPTSATSSQIRLEPFWFPGVYVQLRSAAGDVIDKSRNLHGLTLPLSERAAAARASRKPFLETLSGDVAAQLLGSEGQLRLLTVYYQDPGKPEYCLQVAATLERVHAALDELRWLFLVFGTAGFLAAGVASWVMARRSLNPIGRLARQARELTAAHLDRRIATPRGRDEVSELVATFNEMLDRLEAAFRAQERFIADVSHELKTPLSVLLAEAQVRIRQHRTVDEYTQFASSVQDEMRRLAQVVDSLLMLARAKAGFPISFTTPISLNEVVADAVQRCQPLTVDRKIRLVPTLAWSSSDDAEPVIRGDGELLGSMVGNLVRNAIRHSPDGGAVEITVRVEERIASISVRDCGPGIPAALLARIFDQFSSPSQEKPVARGTGIGLSIAKGIAELHGGSIAARNNAAGGAEFIVCLPMDRPQ